MKKPMMLILEIEIPVLAETEEEAKGFLEEAIDDICDLKDFCYTRPLDRLPNICFDGGDFVYHDGTEDITVRELLEKNPEYVEMIKQFRKIKKDIDEDKE